MIYEKIKKYFRDKNKDQFINIKFNIYNIQIYFIRKSIFSFIKNNLNKLEGKLLDVGCGKMPYKEFILKNSKITTYVGIDIEKAHYDDVIVSDLIWDGENIPVEDSSFNNILLTEVLEHCPSPKVVLDEANRVLVTGGNILITVPFIFPLHESPYDEYRYTPYSLKRILEECKFRDIEIKFLGGVNAAIALMLSFHKNKYFKLLMMPLIYLLIKTDKPDINFKDGAMFTGLSIVAKK